MKYASDDLRNEHDGILFGLKILERMIVLYKQTQSGDMDDFIEIVDFFRIYADKCHHGKEETMFFPAMENAGIDRMASLIDELLTEHIIAKRYLSQMVESITGDLINSMNLIKSSNDYVDLLRLHIGKENTVTFPMGDAMIPMKIQTDLLLHFENFEETVLGRGMHMKLHDILNKFEDKYLTARNK